jgi:STE24 endopeptidase
MPFIYLLLFALILLQTQWPEPPAWLTPEGCAMLVGTMVLTSWLSAGLIAKTLCWQLTRHPGQRSSLLRRYARWRRNHFIALLASYLASLYLLGWGDVLFRFLNDWIPAWFRSKDNLPGFQVGLMVPLFAALLLAWERFHQVEKTAYELTHDADHFIPKWAYLLMQIRHQFLFVMPPIVLLFFQQILTAVLQDGDEQNYLLAGSAFAMMASAFLAMPIFLRFFLGLKPLPPGPLRDRLENTAQRLRFRYSNVLVWNTRNLIANAMVTGFIPWVRYVILTDRLINDLTPDEIEAVFGHEVGHIKHHHLIFYLAFFLTSFLLLGLIWGGATNWITQADINALLTWLPVLDDDTLQTLGGFLKLGLLAAYALFFFGFISRRCERQADLFGAGTVSTDVFIAALEKVADINGIPRNRFSWLHPTIDQRVEFLREMRDHPARIPRFQLSVFLMQWALYGVLGLFLGFLFWTLELAEVLKLLAEF